ncbi:MAG: late competence development ComFB family protein [Gammaproteobacteria bacterium]|nr:late competence development ComFB family protein [Gammaproteobacteria bacterium]
MIRWNHETGRFEFEASDLAGIRNRNEGRVAAAMAEVLEEFPGFGPEVMDLQDVYALALNALPPRYVQREGIVLREPVTDNDVREAVREAVRRVMERPNY